ncbi:conjugal transfer protein TraE, partial [Klebsiella pneumoniae]
MVFCVEFRKRSVVQLESITAVGLMSTPNVAESYQSKFKGRNGLDKVLG